VGPKWRPKRKNLAYENGLAQGFGLYDLVWKMRGIERRGRRCWRSGYLFCVGIDISGDSRGSARGSATDTGSDAVFCGGDCSLWLDDRARGTFTEQAGVEVSDLTWAGDLRSGLRAAFLGGAAGAFGYCRSNAGVDSAFMALSEIIFLRTQTLTVRLVVALLIGIGGVAVLMSRSLNLGGAPIDKRGAAALILASMSWSVASALTRKLTLPKSKVMSSGAQMLAGGVLLAVTAAALGEFRNFHPWNVSREVWFALLYLIVAGSIVGFTAYVWLIHHESPTKVGTYAYVNPIVAVLVGYFFGGEALSLRTILGTMFVLISVVVITTTPAKKTVAALPGEKYADTVKS
jgi:drug/metabolite transporter (DMT)-like permease